MIPIGTPVKVITKSYGNEQYGLTGIVEKLLVHEDFGFDCGVRIDDKQGPYYSNHYLYFRWDHLELLSLKYDPNQQGDTDEDI